MMQLGGTTAAPAAAATTAAPALNSDAAAASTAVAAASASLEVGSAEDISDRGFGGNRWPRQETQALLKIRSEMDIAFRDASIKGPLWDEVSRKMGEFGYNRSAKKCKEKFENVFKYHKRTKEGRTGKSDGKTYRFYDQIEALLNQSSSSSALPQTQMQLQFQSRPHNNNGRNVTLSTPPPQPAATANNLHPGIPVTTVTSTMPVPNITVPTFTQAVPTHVPSFPSISGDFMSDSTSSSSTSSDVEVGGGRRKNRKRKWKDFFERLMKQVVEKQEELQKKFLEAVEKREQERMIREEAWRMQEMARISREREILAQERSMAAAKDAAVMTILQKLSVNPDLRFPLQPQPQPPPVQTQPPPTAQPPVPQAEPPPHQPQQRPKPVTGLDLTKADNGDRNFSSPSSSRWPKVEIEALIKLRTNLDSKYQENGPKGPLWEEVSGGMKRLGFNRNAKRCKEKWENINKYFKKVKESNKKRPEDSKTCPYFHQLDALYREKNKANLFLDHNMASTSSTSTSGHLNLENAIPLMVQPEQQWPPPQTQTEDRDQARNPDGRDGRDEDECEEDDEDGGDGDEGEFEIVPNNNNKSMSTGTNG